ncbi:hypothetical protein ACHHV8_28550 [Paenibacillus sp. TAB 01]|uniref:hypothetical protein n=1 Tax=Paenibacillus sp. TAB 01 TaxID=3368988 RepID=UPI0037521E92
MNTDLAALLFIILLSVLLYLPRYFRPRSRSSHPKVTDLNSYKQLRKERCANPAPERKQKSFPES